MKIAIVGKGNVGSALERGLSRAGHEVEMVGNDPARARALADAAEVVILAVPYRAIDDVARELGDAADGKPVIDTTNPIASGLRLAVGFTNSAAEEIQGKLPRANVVKAFNTVFASRMDSGRAKGEQLTVLVAGDDDAAKRKVIELAESIGFDGVDAGPLENARLLEPMALQLIALGYGAGHGTDIGFKLAH